MTPVRKADLVAPSAQSIVFVGIGGVVPNERDGSIPIPITLFRLGIRVEKAIETPGRAGGYDQKQEDTDKFFQVDSPDNEPNRTQNSARANLLRKRIGYA